VSFLLVLQTRGQLNAIELAELLGVSERTVQRDAQALAEAGVPIVSVRGPQAVTGSSAGIGRS
jgi:Predicted transcriptional regulator